MQDPKIKNKLLPKPYKIDFWVAITVTVPGGTATKSPTINDVTIISNILVPSFFKELSFEFCPDPLSYRV